MTSIPQYATFSGYSAIGVCLLSLQLVIVACAIAYSTFQSWKNYFSSALKSTVFLRSQASMCLKFANNCISYTVSYTALFYTRCILMFYYHHNVTEIRNGQTLLEVYFYTISTLVSTLLK